MVAPVTLCAAGLWVDARNRRAALELVFTAGDLRAEDAVRIELIDDAGEGRDEDYASSVQVVEAIVGPGAVDNYEPVVVDGVPTWPGSAVDCGDGVELRRAVAFFRPTRDQLRSRVGARVQLFDHADHGSPEAPVNLVFDRRCTDCGLEPVRVLADGDVCFTAAAQVVHGTCERPSICALEVDGAVSRCREAADAANTECPGQPEADPPPPWIVEGLPAGECGGHGTTTIWQYTAGPGGGYVIRLRDGSGAGDPVLHVRWACESVSATLLACDDAAGGESQVVLELQAGEVVYVYASGVHPDDAYVDISPAEGAPPP